MLASPDAQERETKTPRDRYQAKMLIASTYKFYLAIENSILRDYCTEKFFQGFMTSTVMVRPWFHVVSFLIEFSLRI